MSSFSGAVGMIPGEFCELMHFGLYFDAILPSESFFKNIHLLHKIITL